MQAASARNGEGRAKLRFHDKAQGRSASPFTKRRAEDDDLILARHIVLERLLREAR